MSDNECECSRCGYRDKGDYLACEKLEAERAEHVTTKAKLAEVTAQAVSLRVAVDAWMHYGGCLCDGMPQTRLEKEFGAALTVSEPARFPDAGRALLTELTALREVVAAFEARDAVDGNHDPDVDYECGQGVSLSDGGCECELHRADRVLAAALARIDAARKEKP